MIARFSAHLQLEAFRMLVTETKQGLNIGNYANAVAEFHKVAPNDPLARLDEEWVQNVAKKIKTQTDRLEAELKAYKNNMIKESIRVSYGPLS